MDEEGKAICEGMCFPVLVRSVLKTEGVMASPIGGDEAAAQQHGVCKCSLLCQKDKTALVSSAPGDDLYGATVPVTELLEFPDRNAMTNVSARTWDLQRTRGAAVLSRDCLDPCVCPVERFDAWLTAVILCIPPPHQLEDAGVRAKGPHFQELGAAQRADALQTALARLQKAVDILERRRYKLMRHKRILDLYYMALEEDIDHGASPFHKKSDFHYYLRQRKRDQRGEERESQHVILTERLGKLYYALSKLESIEGLGATAAVAANAAAGPWGLQRRRSVLDFTEGVVSPTTIAVGLERKKAAHGDGQTAEQLLNFSVVNVPYPPLQEEGDVSTYGTHQPGVPACLSRDAICMRTHQPSQGVLRTGERDHWWRAVATLARRAKSLQDALALPLPPPKVRSRLRNELLFSFSARVLALRDSKPCWGAGTGDARRRLPTHGEGPRADELQAPPPPPRGTLVSFVEWYVREVLDPFATSQLLMMAPLEYMVTTACRIIYACEVQRSSCRLEGEHAVTEGSRRDQTGDAAREAYALPDLSQILLQSVREGRISAFAQLALSPAVSFLNAHSVPFAEAVLLYAALLSGQVDLLERLLACNFAHPQLLHVFLFLHTNTTSADCAEFIEAKLQLVRVILEEYTHDVNSLCGNGPVAGTECLANDTTTSAPCAGMGPPWSTLHVVCSLLLQHLYTDDFPHEAGCGRKGGEEAGVPELPSPEYLHLVGESDTKGTLVSAQAAAFFQGPVQRLRLLLQVQALALQNAHLCDGRELERGMLRADDNDDDAPLSMTGAFLSVLSHKLGKHLGPMPQRGNDTTGDKAQEMAHCVAKGGAGETCVSFDSVLQSGALDACPVSPPDAVGVPGYSTSCLRRVGLLSYTPLHSTIHPLLVRSDVYIALARPRSLLPAFYYPSDVSFEEDEDPSSNAARQPFLASPPSASVEGTKCGTTPGDVALMQHGQLMRRLRRRDHRGRGSFYYETHVSMNYLLLHAADPGVGDVATQRKCLVVGWCTEGMASLARGVGVCVGVRPRGEVEAVVCERSIAESDRPVEEERDTGPRQQRMLSCPGFLGQTREGFGVSLELVRRQRWSGLTRDVLTPDTDGGEVIWRVMRHHAGETSPVLMDSADPAKASQEALLSVRLGSSGSKRVYCSSFCNVCASAWYPPVTLTTAAELSYRDEKRGWKAAGSAVSLHCTVAPDKRRLDKSCSWSSGEQQHCCAAALAFGFLYDCESDAVSVSVNGVSLGVVFTNVSATLPGLPPFQRLYPAATLMATQEAVDALHDGQCGGTDDRITCGPESCAGAAEGDLPKRFGAHAVGGDDAAVAVLCFAFDKSQLLFWRASNLGQQMDSPAPQLLDRDYKRRLLLQTIISASSPSQLAPPAGGGESLFHDAGVRPLGMPSLKLLQSFLRPALCAQRGGRSSSPVAKDHAGLLFHCPVWIPRRSADYDGVSGGHAGRCLSFYNGQGAMLPGSVAAAAEYEVRHMIIPEDMPLTPLGAALTSRLPDIVCEILYASPTAALLLQDTAVAFSAAAIYARKTAFQAACALGYERVVQMLCAYMPTHEVLELFGVNMSRDEVTRVQKCHGRQWQRGSVAHGGHALEQGGDGDLASRDTGSYADYGFNPTSVPLKKLFTTRRDMYTPLHCALLGGNHAGCAMVLVNFLWASLVQRVPSAGHRVQPSSFLKDALNVMTPAGESALFMATRFSNVALAQRLLRLGANPLATDRVSQTHALEMACANGCATLAATFLEQRLPDGRYAYNAAALNQVGIASCVCWCALNNLPDVMVSLLQRGADPRIGLDESSPLLLAVTFKSEEAALALLAHTLTPQEFGRQQRSRGGRDADAGAGLAGDLALEGVSACRPGNAAPSVTEPGLQQPILEVDTLDPRSNCTALHIACELGLHAVTKALLAKGAPLDVRTKTNGYTPLHACLLNHEEAIALAILSHARAQLRRGACVLNLLLADHNGDTTLHVAAREGMLAAVEYLLEHFSAEEIHRLSELRTFGKREPAAAPIDALNHRGVTPLLAAIEAGMSDVAQAIVVLTSESAHEPGGPLGDDGTCVALLQAAQRGLNEVVLSILMLSTPGLYPASKSFCNNFWRMHNARLEGQGGNDGGQPHSETLVACDSKRRSLSVSKFGGAAPNAEPGRLPLGLSVGFSAAHEASTHLAPKKGLCAPEKPRVRSPSATSYRHVILARTRRRTGCPSSHTLAFAQTAGDSRVRRRSSIVRALRVVERSHVASSPSWALQQLLRGFTLPEIYLMLEMVAAENPVIGIQSCAAMAHSAELRGFLQEHADMWVEPARVVPLCREFLAFLKRQLGESCCGPEGWSAVLAGPCGGVDAQEWQAWRAELAHVADHACHGPGGPEKALCQKLARAMRLFGRRGNGLRVLEEMEAAVAHYRSTSSSGGPAKERVGPVAREQGNREDRPDTDHTAAQNGSGAADRASTASPLAFTEAALETPFHYSLLQLAASLELPHVVSFLLKEFPLHPLHVPRRGSRIPQPPERQGQQPPPPAGLPPPELLACSATSHQWLLLADAKWLLTPFRIAVRMLHEPTVAVFLEWGGAAEGGQATTLVDYVEPAAVDPLQRTALQEGLARLPALARASTDRQGKGIGTSRRRHANNRDVDAAVATRRVWVSGVGTDSCCSHCDAPYAGGSSPLMSGATEVLSLCRVLLRYGASARGHFDANGLDAWLLATSIDGKVGEDACSLLLRECNPFSFCVEASQYDKGGSWLLQQWRKKSAALGFLVAPTSFREAAPSPPACALSNGQAKQIEALPPHSLAVEEGGGALSVPERRPPLLTEVSSPRTTRLSSASKACAAANPSSALLVPPGKKEDSDFRTMKLPRMQCTNLYSSCLRSFPISPSGLTAKVEDVAEATDDGPTQLNHFYNHLLLFSAAEFVPTLLACLLRLHDRTLDVSTRCPLLHHSTGDTLLIFLLRKAYAQFLVLRECGLFTQRAAGEAAETLSRHELSSKTPAQANPMDQRPRVVQEAPLPPSVQMLLETAMDLAAQLDPRELYRISGDGATALLLAAYIGYLPLVYEIVVARPRAEFGSTAVSTTVEGADVCRAANHSESCRELLSRNLAAAAVRDALATQLYYDEEDAAVVFAVLASLPPKLEEEERLRFLRQVYPNVHSMPALRLAVEYAASARKFLLAPACLNAFWINLLYVQYCGRLGELNIDPPTWSLLLHALLPCAPAMAIYLIKKKSARLENAVWVGEGKGCGGDKSGCKPKSAASAWVFISRRVDSFLQMMLFTVGDQLLRGAAATASLAHAGKAEFHRDLQGSGALLRKRSTTTVRRSEGPPVAVRATERPRPHSTASRTAATGGSLGGDTLARRGWSGTLLGDVLELAIRYDDVGVFRDLVELRLPQPWRAAFFRRPSSKGLTRVGSNFSGVLPRLNDVERFSVGASVEAGLLLTCCPSLAHTRNARQLCLILQRMQHALWRSAVEDAHVDLLAVAAGSIELLRCWYKCAGVKSGEDNEDFFTPSRQFFSPLRYDRVDMNTGLPEGVSLAVGGDHTEPVAEPLEKDAVAAGSERTSTVSTRQHFTASQQRSSANADNRGGAPQASEKSHSMELDSLGPACDQALPVMNPTDAPLRIGGAWSAHSALRFSDLRGGSSRTTLFESKVSDDYGNDNTEAAMQFASQCVSTDVLGATYGKRQEMQTVLWGLGAATREVAYQRGRFSASPRATTVSLPQNDPCMAMTAVWSLRGNPFGESVSAHPLGRCSAASSWRNAATGHDAVSGDIPRGSKGALSTPPTALTAGGDAPSNHQPTWFMYRMGDWALHTALVLNSPCPSLSTLDVLEFFLDLRAPLTLSVLQLFLAGSWLTCRGSNATPHDRLLPSPLAWHTREGQGVTIQYKSHAHGDTLLHLLVINDQCELAEYYLAYCLYYFVRLGLDTPPPWAAPEVECPDTILNGRSLQRAQGGEEHASHGVPLPVHFLRTMLCRNAHGLAPMDYAHSAGMLQLLQCYECAPPPYRPNPQQFARLLGLHEATVCRPRNPAGSHSADGGEKDRPRAGGSAAERGKLLKACGGGSASAVTGRGHGKKRGLTGAAAAAAEDRGKGFFPVPRLVLASASALQYHDCNNAGIISNATELPRQANLPRKDAHHNKPNQAQAALKVKASTALTDLGARGATSTVSDAMLHRNLLVTQRHTHAFLLPILLHDDVSFLHLGLCSCKDELVMQGASTMPECHDSHAAAAAKNTRENDLDVTAHPQLAMDKEHGTDVMPPSLNPYALSILPPLPNLRRLSLSLSWSQAAVPVPKPFPFPRNKTAQSPQTQRTRRASKTSLNATKTSRYTPPARTAHDLVVSLEKLRFVVYALGQQPILRPLKKSQTPTKTRATTNRHGDGAGKPPSKAVLPESSARAFLRKIMAFRHDTVEAAATRGAAPPDGALGPPSAEESPSLLLSITPMHLAIMAGAVKRAAGSEEGAQKTRGGEPPDSSAATESFSQYKTVAAKRASAPLSGTELIVTVAALQPPPFCAAGHSGTNPLASASQKQPSSLPAAARIGAAASMAGALDAWAAHQLAKLLTGRKAHLQQQEALNQVSEMETFAVTSSILNPSIMAPVGDDGLPLFPYPVGGVATAEQQSLVRLLLREFARCAGTTKTYKEVGLVINPNYDVDTAGDAIAALRQMKSDPNLFRNALNLC